MQQVWQDNRGHQGVAEVPEPMPPDNGVLVQNHYSLISPGTERAMIELSRKSLWAKARSRPDLIAQVIHKMRTEGIVSTLRKVDARLDKAVPLGYSSAGTVVVSTSDAFAPGDRVACAGFGYASHAGFVSVPQNLVTRIPEGVSYREAATVTIGSIALQGVRMAEPLLGDTVAVIGLGLLGQITTMLLAANGCRVLGIDPATDRAELARTNGAHQVSAASTAEDIRHLAGACGVDKVIITAATSSNGPIETAGVLCRDKGRVVVVGDVRVDLPRKDYYGKELEIRYARSYGPGRYDPSYEEGGHDYPYGYVRWTEQRNMSAYLELIGQSRISPDSLITHTFPVAQAQDAYDIISGETAEPHLALLLSYPEDPELVRRITLHAPRQRITGRTRIGFLGAGNFSTGVLLPQLKKTECELNTICSRNGLSARSAGKEFGFAQVSTDPVSLIEEKEIDLVVIATPHHLHASQVSLALKAGKAVFVEKPLATSYSELDQVVDAYVRNPQPLCVGFNRRFAPLTAELKAFFADCSTPLVIHYRILAGSIPASSPFQDAATGGRIVGEVCHFVDYCRYLAGSPIMRVSGEAIVGHGEMHPPDNLQATLKFNNGSIATISYVASADPAPGKEEITVMGGGRTAILNDFRELNTFQGGRKQQKKAGQDKGHAALLDSVVKNMNCGAGMPIPFDEIVEVTRATLQIALAVARINEQV